MSNSLLSSPPTSSKQSIRYRCQGSPPLEARLEEWMVNLFDDSTLHETVAKHGSPVNFVAAQPMARHIASINDVARVRELDFKIFFARKSNKCLSFVDQAIDSEIGVDTASVTELLQSLDRGIQPANLICTAAVKNESLIDLCISKRICIAIDNSDELQVICARAQQMRGKAHVAIRLGGFLHNGRKLSTRFGFDVDRDRNLPTELAGLPVEVVGIHFHLDGYDSGQRVSALRESLAWIERLRDAGHEPKFVDMGGGFPISYLNEPEQWDAFWDSHRAALLGEHDEITYRNHALGRTVVGNEVVGKPNTYPYFQTPTREAWLASILNHEEDGQTVADQIRKAAVQLRCEPGRSLLDGCGMTVARVEFRKQNAGGDWLIGLSMNRTQCRTSSDDFLVDPILIPSSSEPTDAMSGYLVGAYCTESELLTLRKLHFPDGVRRGDLIAFPNTAGYLMHFLESRSHQFPLAKNIVVDGEATAVDWQLDPIDNQPA